MHKLAGANPSPLSADGYEKMLKDLDLFHAYSEVVEGLRSGFDFGIPPVSSFRSPPNHGSATNDFDTLNASIDKEVSLGRSLGPFSQDQVEMLGPFQTSPLGLVPKPNGKWRMVQDFSYPKKGAYASVNSYIESDEFVCAWDGFLALVDLIRSFPSGSDAAMADAGEAFRAIPARPDQLPGLVYKTPDNRFIVDLRLPFGLASAIGVWGLVADATRAIIERLFEKEGVRVVKWVDDFVFVRPPTCPVSLDDIMAATAPLGFPWHATKRSAFAPTIRFIGFHFDLHHYTVWLPDDKAAKFLDRIKVFTTRGPISLKQTQEVIGSLQHVAVMARDLAPYLSEMVASLYAFEDKNPFAKLFVGDKVRSDAKEWVSALSSNFRRSFAAPGPPFELPIYVDASTEWGVGILVGERWAAWRLQPGWEADASGILWAEAIALEFGILAALALGAEGHSVLVHGDNQGVIGSFRRGRSRGRQANSVLKRILKLERTWRVEETTLPGLSHFVPTRHPSRSSLGRPRLIAPSNALLVDVSFPWTKSTRAAGIVKAVVSVGGRLDPLAALLHHLSLSPVDHALASSTPLFAFRSNDSPPGSLLRPLTKIEFLAEFNAALVRAGRVAFLGHSFRIGGATVHWHAGAAVADIKLLDGWTSNSVNRYLRDYGRGLLAVHQRTAASIANVSSAQPVPLAPVSLPAPAPRP
ncbi:hypothetical protein CF328_g8112 [Tilletia controversa]|nr:hypothetical protein CF328_g8112 [Tilletia controversa]